MSADNGVYILKTKDGIRVAHCQAIENINWDGNKVNSEYFNKEYLKLLFGDSKVFQTEEEAMAEAKLIYDEIMSDDFCPICEYGICWIIGSEKITFPK